MTTAALSPSRHLGRKILMVGNLFGWELGNDFYMTMPKLLHGFIRLGCNVHVFNDREVARASTPLLHSDAGRRAAKRKLRKTCLNFRPDLVLLGHCEAIDNATFEAIRQDRPETRFALRNIDAITDAKNRARVQRRAQVVDAIFLTVAAPLHGVPPDSRARVYFMPNPVDPAIDKGRGFARSDQPHDLFFASGARNDARLALVDAALARLPQLRADIRGHGRHTPPVRGAAYLDAMAGARMGLSISRPDNLYLYASDRMSQLLGNGLLTLQSRSSGFQDIFDEDQIAFYDGLDELVAQLDRFSRDDSARRRVAEAGWRAAHAMFASHRVAKYILERSFEEPLSEVYPWPTAIDMPDEDGAPRSEPLRPAGSSTPS